MPTKISNSNLRTEQNLDIVTAKELVSKCTKNTDTILYFFRALSDYTMSHFSGFPLKIVPDDKKYQIQSSRNLKNFILANLINNYDPDTIKLCDPYSFTKVFIPVAHVETVSDESQPFSYILRMLINTADNVLKLKFEVDKICSLQIFVIKYQINTKSITSKNLNHYLYIAEDDNLWYETKELYYSDTKRIIDMIEVDSIDNAKDGTAVGKCYDLFNRMRLERYDIISGQVLNDMYAAISEYVEEINGMIESIIEDTCIQYRSLAKVSNQLSYQSTILETVNELLFREDGDIPIKIVFERLLYIMKSIETVLTSCGYIKYIHDYQDELKSLHAARMNFNKMMAFAIRFKDIHPEF